MSSLNQRRQWMIGVFGAALLGVTTASQAAPLLVTSVEVDAAAGRLFVYGEGFGTTTPAARFAGLSVSVLTSSDTVLSLSIPFGLLKTPGTYLLAVSGGPAPEQNSALGVTVGVQGPKGDIGPVGPKGDTGAKGAKGATGDTGPVGPKGDTGATGLVGPKGDTGATGAIGPVGATGAQGEMGPPGPKGDKGDTGPAGAGVNCAAQAATGSAVRGAVFGGSAPITGTVSVPALSDREIRVLLGYATAVNEARFLVQCRNGTAYVLDVYAAWPPGAL